MSPELPLGDDAGLLTIPDEPAESPCDWVLLAWYGVALVAAVVLAVVLGGC